MENPHLEALPKQEKKEEKKIKKNLKPNLCKGKQIAMEDLGGILVIVDVQKYINEPTANYLINGTTRLYRKT